MNADAPRTNSDATGDSGQEDTQLTRFPLDPGAPEVQRRGFSGAYAGQFDLDISLKLGPPDGETITRELGRPGGE